MCESTAQWRLIGQQVMMAHLAISGTPLNPDQWDGYPGSRNRFLNTLDRCGVDNVVVLTGDIHTSWANEVTLDPLDPAVYNPATSEGSLAVEFVCTSVTSSSADSFGSLGPFLDNATELVLESNPHMRWLDLTQKGYLLVDLDTERVKALGSTSTTSARQTTMRQVSTSPRRIARRRAARGSRRTVRPRRTSPMPRRSRPSAPSGSFSGAVAPHHSKWYVTLRFARVGPESGAACTTQDAGGDDARNDLHRAT